MASACGTLNPYQTQVPRSFLLLKSVAVWASNGTASSTVDMVIWQTATLQGFGISLVPRIPGFFSDEEAANGQVSDVEKWQAEQEG